MADALLTLDRLPIARDFYAQYWNTQPFVVRGAIPADHMNALIAADELAGLAMEDEPRARMIQTAGDYQDWTCRHGPFSEEDYARAGDENWSLLVQNVEQFHPDTAELLRHFDFAPKWLMDDIMVGYSSLGGTVGPHMDSYHVFIVQGKGWRRWKVGRVPTLDPVYVEGIDLKLLDGGFEGDEVEMTCGDVLYVPPTFAHEGTTLENALTFSVGFLGPKMSELLSAYAQYVAEREELDHRFVGAGLTFESAGYTLAPATVGTLQDVLTRQFKGEDFSRWLVEFFTESSHEDFGDYSEREDVLSAQDFAAVLQDGDKLFKPAYVKFALTDIAPGLSCLGFDAKNFTVDEGLKPFVQTLMNGDAVGNPGTPEHLAFLRELYNHQALEFTDLNA